MLDINKIQPILSNGKIRIVFLFTCLTLSLISFSKDNKRPPNGIKINDTLFIDETEVTNLDWAEYKYWSKRTYGDSISILNCEPKANVFVLDTVKMYSYLSHPAFNTYPILGISYEQAIEYCKWRQDRIYEISLVKNKIIDFAYNIDSTQIFTIGSFLDGSFKCNPKNLGKLKDIPIYKYRLPTLEEYKAIEQDAYVGYLKSLKDDSIKLEKLKTKYKDPNYIEVHAITTDVHWSYPNKLGIFNLTQNITEMTNIEGIAYGGNWTMTEIPEDYTTTYTKPTIWLGFRCIAIKTNFTDYQSVYNKAIDQ